ncbi:unnamed protein product [Amoebophrya sp. A120]|nr:unnamed protein product [Amoebophrya sp. A120]|eukprot:GSA120T00010310001.1
MSMSILSLLTGAPTNNSSTAASSSSKEQEHENDSGTMKEQQLEQVHDSSEPVKVIGLSGSKSNITNQRSSKGSSITKDHLGSSFHSVMAKDTLQEQTSYISVGAGGRPAQNNSSLVDEATTGGPAPTSALFFANVSEADMMRDDEEDDDIDDLARESSFRSTRSRISTSRTGGPGVKKKDAIVQPTSTTSRGAGGRFQPPRRGQLQVREKQNIKQGMLYSSYRNVNNSITGPPLVLKLGKQDTVVSTRKLRALERRAERNREHEDVLWSRIHVLEEMLYTEKSNSIVSGTQTTGANSAAAAAANKTETASNSSSSTTADFDASGASSSASNGSKTNTKTAPPNPGRAFAAVSLNLKLDDFRDHDEGQPAVEVVQIEHSDSILTALYAFATLAQVPHEEVDQFVADEKAEEVEHLDHQPRADAEAEDGAAKDGNKPTAKAGVDGENESTQGEAGGESSEMKGKKTKAAENSATRSCASSRVDVHGAFDVVAQQLYQVMFDKDREIYALREEMTHLLHGGGAPHVVDNMHIQQHEQHPLVSMNEHGSYNSMHGLQWGPGIDNHGNHLYQDNYHDPNSLDQRGHPYYHSGPPVPHSDPQHPGNQLVTPSPRDNYSSQDLNFSEHTNDINVSGGHNSPYNVMPQHSNSSVPPPPSSPNPMVDRRFVDYYQPAVPAISPPAPPQMEQTSMVEQMGDINSNLLLQQDQLNMQQEPQHSHVRNDQHYIPPCPSPELAAGFEQQNFEQNGVNMDQHLPHNPYDFDPVDRAVGANMDQHMEPSMERGAPGDTAFPSSTSRSPAPSPTSGYRRSRRGEREQRMLREHGNIEPLPPGAQSPYPIPQHVVMQQPPRERDNYQRENQRSMSPLERNVTTSGQQLPGAPAENMVNSLSPSVRERDMLNRSSGSGSASIGQQLRTLALESAREYYATSMYRGEQVHGQQETLFDSFFDKDRGNDSPPPPPPSDGPKPFIYGAFGFGPGELANMGRPLDRMDYSPPLSPHGSPGRRNKENRKLDTNSYRSFFSGKNDPMVLRKEKLQRVAHTNNGVGPAPTTSANPPPPGPPPPQQRPPPPVGGPPQQRPPPPGSVMIMVPTGAAGAGSAGPTGALPPGPPPPEGVDMIVQHQDQLVSPRSNIGGVVPPAPPGHQPPPPMNNRGAPVGPPGSMNSAGPPGAALPPGGPSPPPVVSVRDKINGVSGDPSKGPIPVSIRDKINGVSPYDVFRKSQQSAAMLINTNQFRGPPQIMQPPPMGGPPGPPPPPPMNGVSPPPPMGGPPPPPPPSGPPGPLQGRRPLDPPTAATIDSFLEQTSGQNGLQLQDAAFPYLDRNMQMNNKPGRGHKHHAKRGPMGPGDIGSPTEMGDARELERALRGFLHEQHQ